MKTLIVSAVALLSLLIAPLAFAQYYPTSAGCVSLPAGLSIGARGSNVLALQHFLVAQNYPGGGSWMASSYFGQATAAAVRDFQQAQNLPQTGVVDASTAAAISRASCGGTSPVYPTTVYTTPVPTYPTYPTTTYPPYTNYYNNNTLGQLASAPYYSPALIGNNYYGNAPVITSLSQNTGSPGNVVTVNGIGFDPYTNTVNFGGTILSNIPSYNGTSLTFTVPSTVYSYSFSGTDVQLSVSNSRGTSNAISFTVYGGSYGCPLIAGATYPYGQCGCGNNNYYPYTYGSGYNSTYGYNNNSCLPPNTATPVVSYLSPVFGPAGTSVTVYGTGFSTSGNTVHFGTGIIAELNSYDGRSVSFTVPNTLTGFGNQPLTLSTYQVSVSNNQGFTSNSVPFTVTGVISSGAPTITSVNGPTTLALNTQGVWTVNVNTQSNTYLTLSVNWGDQNVYGSAAAQQVAYSTLQQTNTLTHTYYSPGTYTVVFTISNSTGQQNSFTTTVTVGSGTYNPYPQTALVSISNFAFNPSITTVRVGTRVTWTNNDPTPHTVTSDSGSFGSGTLATGQSFSLTFNTPGTFTYHCAIHPMMTGTIVVTQ